MIKRQLFFSILMCCCRTAWAQAELAFRPTSIHSQVSHEQSPLVPRDIFGINALMNPTPGLFSQVAVNEINLAVAAIDAVVSLRPGERTFANTIQSLEIARERIASLQGIADVINEVHPYVPVRDEAREAQKLCLEELARFHGEGVAMALRQFEPQMHALHGEDRLLAEYYMKQYLADSHLEQDFILRTRERLKILETEILNRANGYYDSYHFDAKPIQTLHPEALRDLPVLEENGYMVLSYKDHRSRGIIRGLAEADGADPLIVKLHGEIESGAAWNREKLDDNLKDIDEMLKLRLDLAKHRGFESHAEYRMKGGLLAGSVENVRQLLEEIRTRSVQSGIGRLANWENPYFQKGLFPLDSVLSKIFEVVGSLLGVRVAPVNVVTWDSQVKLYGVEDAESGTTLGYFYADLLQRIGKTPKNQHLPIHYAQDGPFGPHHVSLVQRNLIPDWNGRVFLELNDILNLLHELGHMFHQMLSKTKYGIFTGGDRVTPDNGEVQSKIFEILGWSEDFLRMIYDPSGGYLDSNQLRLAFEHQAVLQWSEIAYTAAVSLMDQELHGPVVPEDLLEVRRKSFADFGYAESPFVKDPFMNLMFFATFRWLTMGQYVSAYYAYLWSQSIASDIARVIEGYGLLDPTGWRMLREHILERGAVDESDQLRAILGKDPDHDALLAWMDRAAALTAINASLAQTTPQ